MHSFAIAVLACFLAELLLPLPVAAVDLSAGGVLKLIDKPAQDKDKAIVKFVREPLVVGPLPDPACPAASSVRLESEAGAFDVDLDCSLWSTNSKGTVRSYKDPDLSTGIQKIVLKETPKGGLLLVKAQGPAYGAVALAGPVTWVESELVVDGTSYCGRWSTLVGSEEKKNTSESVLFKGHTGACVTPTPTPTPAPTTDCGPGGGPYEMTIQEARVTIPGQISFDTRTIADNGITGQLTGPVLQVRAGEDCPFTLTNDLDSGVTQGTCPFHENSAHCADTTALFGQGFPLAFGETSVPPLSSLTYTVSVPADYPPGLHLYRGGYHGSAALQTAGGVAGFVEIENSSFALPAELAQLYADAIDPPLLLQHVNFGASDTGGGAFAMDSYPGWSSSFGAEQTVLPNPTGTNINFTDVVVNGEFQPTIDIDVDTATLLRFGSASTTRLIELKPSGGVSDSCTMRLVSRDGIFQSTPYLDLDVIILLPGSRADVALRCTSIGSFAFAADPSIVRSTELGTLNRHSQATVMVVNVNAGGGSVALPTSGVTLPSSFDSLVAASAESLKDPLTGAAVTSINLGAGGTPGSFGVNGVSFPGHAAAETSRYVGVACVGKVYELVAVGSPTGGHVMSFDGLKVQLMSDDSISGTSRRAGEWRDVVIWRSGMAVRFAPTTPGDYMIGASTLQKRDLGMAALIRVAQAGDPGVGAWCDP